MRVLPALALFPLISLLAPAFGAGASAALGQEETGPSRPPGKPLGVRPPTSETPAEAAESLRISRLPLINGLPYDQPSGHDLFVDYLRDSYGAPAFLRTTVRALYAEGRGKPEGWGQDFPGFAQRFGSSAAVTAINGNVRYAMEMVFHEDLRYLPCHRCTAKHKIENALLAEITARHGVNGHRFFTLTPTIADFAGPIIAHSVWYPGLSEDARAGAVASRTVFATRIGSHLFREFVIDRRKAKKEQQ